VEQAARVSVDAMVLVVSHPVSAVQLALGAVAVMAQMSADRVAMVLGRRGRVGRGRSHQRNFGQRQAQPERGQERGTAQTG